MTVRIKDGFWKEKTDMVAERMLPYQWDALSDSVPGAEPSHALENFRIAAGVSEGRYCGTIFQDSDVAKWLEAACLSLMTHPDEVLASHVDEAVKLIEQAQEKDGYINTHSRIAAPDRRWSDVVWGHELYCAGHLMEAAVAHYRLTGRKDLLDCLCRYADCIDTSFGPEPGKKHTAGGHPEIELALFKLYGVTGIRRYRDLALYFINVRGTNPEYYSDKVPQWFNLTPDRWFGPDYFLSHKPVREQKDADGHAVRAMYLYSGMADAYAQTGDKSLLDALHALWQSTTGRRMYVTGGIGSQGHAERFTCDYDLPPDTAYAETCASIGLVFWAERMLRIEDKSAYADVIERALYNGILSGVSLDGTKFFYVNPLEMEPERTSSRFDHHYVKSERVQWFGCACCPPNIARLVASVQEYICHDKPGVLFIDQYASCSREPDEGMIGFDMETGYPWDGAAGITVHPASCGENCAVNLRKPGWCESYEVSVNGISVSRDAEHDDGYIHIERTWKDGDIIRIVFGMDPFLVYSDVHVADTAGKAAVQRGPVVYCIEGADNGTELHELCIDPQTAFLTEQTEILGRKTVVIKARGYREQTQRGGLYTRHRPEHVPAEITAVPYHQWGNRKPGNEMSVWIRCAE